MGFSAPFYSASYSEKPTTIQIFKREREKKNSLSLTYLFELIPRINKLGVEPDPEERELKLEEQDVSENLNARTLTHLSGT